MRLTLKTINDELKRLGINERLESGDGYFYFWSGEANNWLPRTVKVPAVNSLTLEQWVDEYKKLKKVNAEMLHGKAGASKRDSKARPAPLPKRRKP